MVKFQMHILKACVRSVFYGILIVSLALFVHAWMKKHVANVRRTCSLAVCKHLLVCAISLLQ